MQHGWAPEVGFPALVLCEDGLEIEGLLFSSDALSGYRRSSTTSRARATSGCSPESGIAMVESSLPTSLWSRQSGIKLAQADSARRGASPRTGAAH
jgi:hypothetical protein